MSKVLIDTSVWSMAFRRAKPGVRDVQVTEELIALVRECRVAIIGPIRQELLSGISNQAIFHELRQKISIFADYLIRTEDYEQAAEYANMCRKNGVQGSHTDFLICAVAVRNGWEIFTEDNDFRCYQKYLPITLHELPSSEVKQ